MATYYWVGGTGTWSATGNTQFAITSGGAATLLNPNSADTVIFDSASGTGTCTTASGAVAAAITLNSATLALTLGANLTIAGFFTHTLGALSLTGNSGNWTLSVFGLISFSGAGVVRSIAFGTGNINLTGNNDTIWQINLLVGWTYTGTPTVNATYSGGVGTRRITHGYFSPTSGGDETNAVSFNITAGTDATTFAIDGDNHVKNLNFTGYSGTFTIGFNNYIYGNLTFSSGMSVTGTRPIVFSLSSGTQQITSNGKTLGSTITKNGNGTFQLQDNFTTSSNRTFTLTAGTLNLNNQTLSAGSFASNNSNIRVIAFGTGNITTTGSGIVWTTATPTNFSCTGTPTINISNNSATAATVSTGVMTEAQALSFNYTTGTYTLTDTAAVYRSVNFTGFAGTIPNSVRTIFGSLTLSTGMTLTAGANATTFASTSAGNTITNAGKTQDYPIIFNGIGGTFAFQDALTQGSTRAFTVTNGTVQLKNGVTSTVGAFATSGTNQKFLQSTTPGSQATLSQASGTVNASYLTIKDINATGGATWNALWSNNNVDLGNNTGWVFGDQPIINAVEYTYKIRSFTQPRRF
jgi:hypothetical protein